MNLNYDEVIQGNIELHKLEASYYDVIHYEIWDKKEQTRLKYMLKQILTLLPKQHDISALDFGAGTGNITEKLRLRLRCCSC